MNDRLKELAIEANLIASEPNGFDPTRLSISQQRFAELIVRECAEVAFKTDVSYTEIDAMHRIRDRIKNHFGVEE